MKKALLVTLMLATANVFAYQEDPHQQFDMTRNESNQVKISFIHSSNVQSTCSSEAIKRGKIPFNFSVEACSFWNWDKTECTIVTANTANFHTIGHEVRHCLQGNFHK